MSRPILVPDIASLKEWIDRPLGRSDWETVGQDRIDAFAQATGDHQWIHVDVDRARRESPFGQPIAHGYLTLSLVPKLLAQLLEVKKLGNVVNSGIEKLRLATPVPAGARVRLSAEIKGVRDLPTGGSRVVFAVSIEVEGNTRPALSGRVIYVYLP